MSRIHSSLLEFRASAFDLLRKVAGMACVLFCFITNGSNSNAGYCSVLVAVPCEDISGVKNGMHMCEFWISTRHFSVVDGCVK